MKKGVVKSYCQSQNCSSFNPTAGPKKERDRETEVNKSRFYGLPNTWMTALDQVDVVSWHILNDTCSDIITGTFRL